MNNRALSLKALQAFEAAARTGSFVAAARELGVGAAAISQLVRGLEHRIGRPLFSRSGRQVHLTEAGREALPRLSAAFTDMRAAAAHLIHRQHRARLSVAVPASMAASWLPHRLPRFLAGHPEIDLQIMPLTDGRATDTADVSLSYGSAGSDDALPLDHVFPLCSPALLAETGPFSGPADLATAPLIETDWGPNAANFPNWSGFLGQPAPRPRVAAHLSESALNLARAGTGIALVQGIYAADALADGDLVHAAPMHQPLNQPYHLACRRPDHVGVAAFHDWLRAEIVKAVSIPETKSEAVAIGRTDTIHHR